jgi:hypothetical protein
LDFWNGLDIYVLVTTGAAKNELIHGTIDELFVLSQEMDLICWRKSKQDEQQSNRFKKVRNKIVKFDEFSTTSGATITSKIKKKH